MTDLTDTSAIAGLDDHVYECGSVVVLSGGMDSTVAAYLTAETFGPCLRCVSFDYGQRHRRELEAAAAVAAELNAPHYVIDLTSITGLLTTSALTNPDVDVPHGHYADESMRATVVPNRNAVMLAAAAAIAIAEDDRQVVTGVHAGDHPIYPDCRPEFIDAMTVALRAGNEGYCDPNFRVWAPFVHVTKTDIVRYGSDLAVPFELTWSCYEGRSVHCGECGTCVERREAFRDAGVHDPTMYA